MADNHFAETTEFEAWWNANSKGPIAVNDSFDGFGEGCIAGLAAGFVLGLFALMIFLWLVTGWQPGDRCGTVTIGLKDGKAIATQICSRELQ